MRSNKLIGLAGRAGAGKSTVADYLAPNQPVKLIKYDNPWAYILSNLFGWNYSDLSIPKSRDLATLRTGCQMLQLNPDPMTVIEAFDWTHMALTRLHPNIEAVILMEFQAPDFSEPSKSKYVQIGFADPLKRICIPLSGLPYSVLLGLDIASRSDRERPIREIIPEFWHSTMSGRQLLELVGTECFRSLDDLIWIKLAQRRIQEYAKMNYRVIVSDVRFKNEAEMIHNLGGFILVLARHETDLLLTDADRQTHVSKWEFLTFIDHNDILIMNDSSIEDLRNNVDLFKSAAGFNY